MEFQEGRGMFEIALLLTAAGEALVVQAKRGEGAMGVDDVGALKGGGFERGDAVESPGGTGEFLAELGLASYA
jgi:hypothetical protein